MAQVKTVAGGPSTDLASTARGNQRSEDARDAFGTGHTEQLHFTAG